MELNDILTKVLPLDLVAINQARQRQAQLAKPPGSLGRLEDLSIQLAGITGQVHNKIKKKHLLVFAADNGVVEEGVSSAPQSVTLMQTINLTRHKTGASTLCKHFGCEISRILQRIPLASQMQMCIAVTPEKSTFLNGASTKSKNSPMVILTPSVIFRRIGMSGRTAF